MCWQEVVGEDQELFPPSLDDLDTRRKTRAANRRGQRKRAKRALDGAEVEIPVDHEWMEGSPFVAAPPVLEEDMCAHCKIHARIRNVEVRLDTMQKHLREEHPVRGYDAWVLIGKPAYDAMVEDCRQKAVPLGDDRYIVRGHRCYARRFNFEDPFYALPPQ